MHLPVRGRVRGGDFDASTGACSSWTAESGVKRLAGNCLSPISKIHEKAGCGFWQPASCIQPVFSVLEIRAETPIFSNYFFWTYFKQSSVTAVMMMMPSNTNCRFVSIPRMVRE